MLDNITTKVVGGVISLLSASIVWLVRTILTNNKKIAILEAKTEADAKNQERILDQMKEIRSEVREIHFKLYPK